MRFPQSDDPGNGWEIVYEKVFPPNQGRATALPSATPNVCRFCGRTLPEATFRKQAHVIPHALGNVEILSSEECDDCNSRGGRYEADLVAFLAMERLTANMQPAGWKLKVADDAGHMELSEGRVHLLPLPGDPRLVVRANARGLRFSAMLQSFRVGYIARALVRMAIFLARPEDLPHLRNYVAWVRGEKKYRGARFFKGTRDFNVGLLAVRLMRRRAPVCYLLGFGYGPCELVYFIDCATEPVHYTLGLPHHCDWKMWEAETDDKKERGHVETRDFVVVDESALPIEPPPHEEIAAAAYRAWERHGRPEGRDLDFWLAAETERTCLRLGFKPVDEEG